MVTGLFSTREKIFFDPGIHPNGSLFYPDELLIPLLYPLPNECPTKSTSDSYSPHRKTSRTAFWRKSVFNVFFDPADTQANKQFMVTGLFSTRKRIFYSFFSLSLLTLD